jgi:predicted RNA binding protein YcfA (HicA-like mRNA interferase family)
MSKKYPLLSGAKIMNALLKGWFVFVSQKGSHLKLCKEVEDTKRIVIIPMHNEVARWTLKSILIQANIELEEFLELL